MDETKHLVSTENLRTTLIEQLAKEGRQSLFVKYDSAFDALIVLVVSPELETVVHYVDDHVALLYLPDTLEIVGLQVEDFEYSFVPQHEALSRLWRLSDTGIKLDNFGDMILAVEKIRPAVAREVVKATEAIVGEPAVELAALLA
jgi:hypothetical protein